MTKDRGIIINIPFHTALCDMTLVREKTNDGTIADLSTSLLEQTAKYAKTIAAFRRDDMAYRAINDKYRRMKHNHIGAIRHQFTGRKR